MNPGDVAILNDPFCGGTHLPDITLVAPVFLEKKTGRPSFFVASRAHHADVGGAYAGSMGICREIYQEGLRIPPIKLLEAGRRLPDIFRLLLNNVRTPEEREGDLNAPLRRKLELGVRVLDHKLPRRLRVPRSVREAATPRHVNGETAVRIKMLRFQDGLALFELQVRFSLSRAQVLDVLGRTG